MPALIGGFGNFLLPLGLGGPDMAKHQDPLVKIYFMFIIFLLSFVLSYLSLLISVLFMFILALFMFSLALFMFSLALLYLDGLILSKYSMFKYIKILYFLVGLLLCLFYLIVFSTDIFLKVGDMNYEIGTKINNELKLKEHVDANDKEANKYLIKKVDVMETMIGLRGWAAKTAAKPAVKYSIPPTPKVGLIVGGGILKSVGKVFNNNLGNFVEKNLDTSVNMKVDIIKINTNHTKIILNSYLAGLFEGDGHIWFPKENAKKKHNPRFCITFSLKNEPLAKKLIEIIGYGFIAYKPKNNACVLVVSPVKGLKKIIELINGELRTPKIIQLHSLIDWINKNHSSNIRKLSLKKGNLNQDSWFAGFIDADGSFSIQHTKIENNAKKRKISCRLRLEQRMYDPISNISYYDVLTGITKFLNCNLKIRKQNSTGNQYFSITASSCKSLSIILTYFNKFPLYTYKYLDYKDWEQAAIIILEKNHYTEQGIVKIDCLKNRMNLKRTYFNWDHLHVF